MEEIQVRRREKRSLAWLLPLALLGLLAILLFTRTRRERIGETETTGAAVPAEVAAACQDDTACAESQLCSEGVCSSAAASTAECQRVTVNFAPEASAITGAANRDVDRLARCLKADHATRVSIQSASGTADPAYADDTLARMRAASLRAALEQRGVPAHQADAIRMGVQ